MFEGFLAELKRRHVIRVAGVYTVAAWAVFQVVKTILETLSFPKWTVTLALALLAFGLPVVLVISWIFERNAKGDIEVTPDAPADAARPRLSRMDMLLLAGLVVVVGLAGAQIGGYLGGGKATILGAGAPEKSVAVLPFVMFSADKDSDYFADGLTEEVINSLAQVPDLKVAGRTSAFYFKGKNEDLREIGKRLGVSHVVEGSVRRDGDRLRVTAQLVSVKDGFHVWSKTYDRKLDDAFAIQSEIGQAVAEALKTKLDMKGATVAAAKRDPAAYQLEITSRAHLRRRGYEELKAARAGFEQLMALEPENARAYAGYAQATMALAQNHLDIDFAEATRVSEGALAKAVTLDPNSLEVWLAKATISRTLSIRVGGAQYEKDYDQAVRRAAAIAPRNGEALTQLAVRLVESGQTAEAESVARRAVAADPLSRSALMGLGRALLQSGKLDEAERQYRAVTDLYPDFTEAKYQVAKVLIERGRLDKAEPWLRAVASAGDDPMPAFELSWLYWNLGLTKEAEQVLDGVTGSPAKELADATRFGMRNDWAGMLGFGKAMLAKSPEPFWPTVVYQAAGMMGRDQEAIAALKKVRPDLFKPDATVSLLDLDMPILLAHLLRRQGDVAQANRLLDQVLLVTAPKPGRRTMNDWRIARAKVFGERGQTAEALAELEAAVNAGWRTPFLFIDSVQIEDQPSLADVRAAPRFRALMAKVRQELSGQSAAVRTERATPAARSQLR